MSIAWKSLKGTLVIKGELCYLAGVTNDAPLFLNGLPTGAGWFDGFFAARAYFATQLGKDPGDTVSFWGVDCSAGQSQMILVRDDRVTARVSDTTLVS